MDNTLSLHTNTAVQLLGSSDNNQPKDLWSRFDILHAKKANILLRCEDYSRWTLPSLFPRLALTENIENTMNIEAIGAKGVNYLSNKLIMTLFQPSQPFFRLTVDAKKLAFLQAAKQQGDARAAQILDAMDAQLAQAEKEAMRALDYNRYRTEATTAAKLLIVTGNALMYHPESRNGKTQVYSIRDYCIVRDLSGQPIEIMTRDCKAFKTFNAEIQAALRQGSIEKRYEDESDVVIYTCLQIEDDGKWHMYQSADRVALDSTGVWTTDDLPWIPLTWNLYRCEDYGRGLIEDYAGALFCLLTLTGSLTDFVAVASDIKWLVDPSSVLDVMELNKAQSGSYHMGKITDVAAMQLNKQMDLQIVVNFVEMLKKELSAVFLLNSSIQRDAERVTAEEIRYMAQELETSHGGIYSRFSEEWQLRTAKLMLKRVKFDAGKDISIQIITGLDSLSKAGEMDALAMWMKDMSQMQELPPQQMNVIDPMRYAIWCAIRRGVDYQQLLKTPQQLQQEQQAAMEQQQQLQNQQAGSKVAQAAGEAAVQGQGQ